jgi:hypothetical protein
MQSGNLQAESRARQAVANRGRKQGRPPQRPDVMRLTHLVGWRPDDRLQRTGRPRHIDLSDRDLRMAVEELVGQGASVDQSLRFLANERLVDQEAGRQQALRPDLSASEAWDVAQAALTADPKRAKREALKILAALRKRYPNVR